MKRTSHSPRIAQHDPTHIFHGLAFRNEVSTASEASDRGGALCPGCTHSSTVVTLPPSYDLPRTDVVEETRGEKKVGGRGKGDGMQAEKKKPGY